MTSSTLEFDTMVPVQESRTVQLNSKLPFQSFSWNQTGSSVQVKMPTPSKVQSLQTLLNPKDIWKGE